MHVLVTPSQLQSRIALLNLTPTALAQAAGVHHTAVTRIINGGNCELSTLTAISRALVEKELELQAHLNALHPRLAGKVEEENA